MPALHRPPQKTLRAEGDVDYTAACRAKRTEDYIALFRQTSLPQGLEGEALNRMSPDATMIMGLAVDFLVLLAARLFGARQCAGVR